MQTIKLAKDIPAEGLVAGDVISVDEFSAASLIARELATEYDPADAKAPTGEDGEQLSGLTIDDIVDPQVARNRRTMTATIVGGPTGGEAPSLPDPDPATSDPAAPASGEGDANPTATSTASAEQQSAPTTSPTGASTTSTSGRAGRGGRGGNEVAAPGPNPAGGDAGGGNSPSA